MTEASRALAEQINAQIDVPDGMRHVGWFCEHPFHWEAPHKREPLHMVRKTTKSGNVKAVVKESVNKSLSFGEYDFDMNPAARRPWCPAAVPVFIKEQS